VLPFLHKQFSSCLEICSIISVEQDVLMSPNPSGKLEDFAAGYVLSSCLKLVNHDEDGE